VQEVQQLPVGLKRTGVRGGGVFDKQRKSYFYFVSGGISRGIALRAGGRLPYIRRRGRVTDQ